MKKRYPNRQCHSFRERWFVRKKNNLWQSQHERQNPMKEIIRNKIKPPCCKRKRQKKTWSDVKVNCMF